MFLSLGVSLLALGPGPTTVVLRGFDPVELVAGKEVAGLDNLTSKHLRYEYRFANAANKAKFDSEPLTYAVQNGGACGRMGELSGRGAVTRWAVVDGKIFLFASESCRDTFLRAKDKFIAKLTAPSAPSEDSDPSEAIEAWKRVRSAHDAGGLAKFKSVTWERNTPYDDAGKQKVWKDFEGFFGEQSWGSWYEYERGAGGYFAKDHDRWEMDSKGWYGVHPGEDRQLRAMIVRHPAAMIAGAPVTPRALVGDGMSIEMTCGDLTFVVEPDPTTKRIRAVSFRDRWAGPICAVRIEYSNYQNLQGVWLPMTSTATVDGEPRKSATIHSYHFKATFPAWATTR